jgi:metal iron transporter
VFTVFISFIILIIKVKPDWVEVFKGFLPSKTIGENANALYTTIGIVGATVMPHALFLGSSLATQNRVGNSFLLVPPTGYPIEGESAEQLEEAKSIYSISNEPLRKRISTWLRTLFSAERVNNDSEGEGEAGTFDRLRFIRSHLKNAMVDLGMYIAM